MKKILFGFFMLFCATQQTAIFGVENAVRTIVAIGSANPAKVEAVKEVINDYALFTGASVTAIAAASDISDQPLSMEEIITGAKNRAKNAFEQLYVCNYSFGIESGLYEVKGSRTGYLEGTICCIYDGTDYYLGLSCSFEVPPEVLNLVLNEKMDLTQAFYSASLSTDPNVGAAQGVIGLLTNGRITRKDYTKQAVTTALIQIEHASWYSN